MTLAGRPTAALALASLLAGSVPGAANAEDPKGFFNVCELGVEGQVRNTVAGDVDDDGLEDLLVTHVVYDEQARRVAKYASLFPQRAGGFAPTPDDTWELPADAVAIDLGNAIEQDAPAPVRVGTDGGVEIDIGAGARPRRPLEAIVARTSGLFAHPIVGGKIAREGVRLAANDSLFNLPDWTAVRLWDFARDLDGDGIDELLLFTATGTNILKRTASGAYSVSQRLATPIKNKITTLAEHEWLVDRVESFAVKFARLIPQALLREWNGDGVPDLVFAWNDQVQVHKGLGGGRFEERAKPFDLRAYTFDQVLRYSRDADILRIEVEDLSGDGLADVLVSRTEIAQLEATNWMDVFYNRGGEIVRSPHRRFRTSGLTDRPLIGDLNGDGRNDMLVWYVELGVGTIINYILWGRATLNQAVYLADANGKIPSEPTSEFDTTFSFIPGKTSSASLAARRIDADFDGDGRKDMLISGGPDKFLLYLNTGTREVFDDEIELDAPASLFTETADLNRDGRGDLVVRHEHRDGLNAKVQVLLSKPGAKFR